MFIVFQVGDRADIPSVPQDFPKCGNYIPSGSTAPSIEIENWKIPLMYIHITTLAVIYFIPHYRV
jgi:hypothetical protein